MIPNSRYVNVIVLSCHAGYRLIYRVPAGYPFLRVAPGIIGAERHRHAGIPRITPKLESGPAMMSRRGFAVRLPRRPEPEFQLLAHTTNYAIDKISV
jgi:hypothetical protein